MVASCWATECRVVGQVLVARRGVTALVVLCVVLWVMFYQHAASVPARSSGLIFHHCWRAASVPVEEAFARMMRYSAEDTVQ